MVDVWWWLIVGETLHICVHVVGEYRAAVICHHTTPLTTSKG